MLHLLPLSPQTHPEWHPVSILCEHPPTHQARPQLQKAQTGGYKMVKHVTLRSLELSCGDGMLLLTQRESGDSSNRGAPADSLAHN